MNPSTHIDLVAMKATEKVLPCGRSSRYWDMEKLTVGGAFPSGLAKIEMIWFGAASGELICEKKQVEVIFSDASS